MAEEKSTSGMQSLGDILTIGQKVKPPAYPWQDLALRIIADLRIPGFKRNAVFKVCKEQPEQFVRRCWVDTQELCRNGQPWQYFFKLITAGPDREMPSQEERIAKWEASNKARRYSNTNRATR